MCRLSKLLKQFTETLKLSQTTYQSTFLFNSALTATKDLPIKHGRKDLITKKIKITCLKEARWYQEKVRWTKK